jgi:hypothetical protein
LECICSPAAQAAKADTSHDAASLVEFEARRARIKLVGIAKAEITQEIGFHRRTSEKRFVNFRIIEARARVRERGSKISKVLPLDSGAVFFQGSMSQVQRPSLMPSFEIAINIVLEFLRAIDVDFDKRVFTRRGSNDATARLGIVDSELVQGQALAWA